VVVLCVLSADAHDALAGGLRSAAHAASLTDARMQFYNGRYELAAASALELTMLDSANLAARELRSSALLFHIQRLMPERSTDRAKALKQCAACPALIAEFERTTADGIAAARQAIAADEQNVDAHFFLGKLNLNVVWLYLGTLGHRAGWNQYWMGRHAIEAALARDPDHLRARVADAWIEYIVDTKMAWGTRWIVGGGNRKRALAMMSEAAAERGDFFDVAEARFALWEVQRREKNLADALRTARTLAHDFPDNRDLAAFIEKRDADSGSQPVVQ
jgi:hypothetical protein